MTTSQRFTSADLKVLPLEDGTRYEIIDGELLMTSQPSWDHQGAADAIVFLLQDWSLRTGRGTARTAPGVIFAEDDDVAPDAVWVSTERLRQILGPDGHLHGAPELMVEVLSPGATNEQRDRQTKLKLYSRRGVDEYWIVEPRMRTIDVSRRRGEVLEFVKTLSEDDVIESPLLPGFAGPVERIFAGIP